MNTAPFSKHIFWSYKSNVDLPESIVIQQVITYGEITDFKKLAALLPKQNIIDAIEKWQNKDKYTKQLIPNLSPITYTETLIYTKDIEEKSIDSHLMPAENITKEQIANFFVDQLRKIKDEID